MNIEEKEKEHKIADVVTRAPRNDWISEIESMIVEKCPYPASYDVNASQPLRFTEFTYTEILGGVYLRTQNAETNARIIAEEGAYTDEEKDVLSPLVESLTDKYILESIGNIGCDMPEDVCFLPGTNLINMLDDNIIARLAFDKEDLMFKPHPLTDDGYLSYLKGQFGGRNIISPNVSGMDLLRGCNTVYSTSASELMIAGALLDKDIVNVGAYLAEPAGVYYAITRVLLAKKKHERKLFIADLLRTVDSGLIFPWMPNVEERVEAFYRRALTLRELHKPLISHYQPPNKRA